MSPTARRMDAISFKNDWPVFRDRMEAMIIGEGLSDHLDGSRVMPPAPGALRANPTDRERDHYYDTIRERNSYVRDEGKARQILLCALDERNVNRVRGVPTVHAMWEALIQYHERRTSINHTVILRELMNMKYEEGSNLEDWFDVIQKKRDQLAGLGEPMSDENMMNYLFISLLDTHKQLIRSYKQRYPTTAERGRHYDDFRSDAIAEYDEDQIKLKNVKEAKGPTSGGLASELQVMTKTKAVEKERARASFKLIRMSVVTTVRKWVI